MTRNTPLPLVAALAAAALGLASPDDPAPPRFVNVAADAGLEAITWCGGADKDHLLESTGAGCALVDLDGDGHLDLYLVSGWALDESPSQVRVRGRNVLYRNRGDGTFEDITTAAGVGDDGWGGGVCAADYDGDGHVDLYITNFGPNVLYRNRGDGTFEDVTAAAGVGDAGWGAGASFFDADGDGRLDLYVANYVESTIDEVLAARRTTRWRDTAMTMVGPFGLRGGRDRFYRQQPDGTFVDATEEAGLTDRAESYGLGVLASDLDGDGDVDLYVANDSNPNYLYRNDGAGTFTEVGAWCGAGFSAAGAAQAGMGVDAGDFDGDGRPDLVVTNFTRDYSTLYRNAGDLFFDDVTERHELRAASYHGLSWGCAFFDFDLDADLDLVIVNGHIYPQVEEHPALKETYRQRPLLLRNDGGRYVDVSDEAGPGFATPIAGRGLAVGDVDGDGDLDLLITTIDGPPVLLRNDTPRRGGWLALRLRGGSGGPAIGAVATVTAGGRVQSRELRSGSTYQSQNALELHFGVGGATVIERVEIRWPDGSRTVRTNVAPNQVLELP